MASITAPGAGSGLDINSIVTQLVAAEKAPTDKRLTSQEALAQAKLSTLGIVKSSVSDFQTSLNSLTSLSAFQSKTATVGNQSLLSVSANSSAKAGQYSVEVTQLAQAQKLASKTFTNTSDSVGSGTLHIKFGTYASDTNKFTENTAKTAVDIAIPADKSSLQGVRDAINAADIGVSARIINDGTGNRLVFSSESGAAQGLQITATDDDGKSTDTSGLSQLTYDPTAAIDSGKNMQQALEPKDAILKVDGLDITRPTNTIDGVIQGVTLNLQSASVGSPTTVSVAEDTSKIGEAVKKFVESFNSLKGVFNKATQYDPAQKKASLLTGDAAVRGMNFQMQRVMGNVVTGLNSNIRALSDIGITTAKDGTLNLDNAKLNSALQNNIDDFAALFATTGRVSDSLVSYVQGGAKTKPGSYDVNITQQAMQGSYSNNIGTGSFTIDGNNDSFKLKVDGFQSGTINLTHAAGLTGTQLAQELQTQINADATLKNSGRSVMVSYDSGTGDMAIKSSRYGSDSQVEVNQIKSGSSVIGLTIKSGTAGQNVAGTIGGVAATGLGTLLTGTGDADGLKVKVEGGATGARGTVSYSKGFAEQLSSVVGGFLDTKGVLTQRMNEFNEQISDIADKRKAMETHLTKYEARLRAQFQSMDALVGQLKSTGDYLTQQLANLPKSN